MTKLSTVSLPKICSVWISGIGDHLIGMRKENIQIDYKSRATESDPTDYVIVNMGKITNVGQWGWQPFNLTNSNAMNPDMLTLQFFLKTTDHQLSLPNLEHPITLMMFLDDSSFLVTSFVVEVASAIDPPNITVMICFWKNKLSVRK